MTCLIIVCNQIEKFSLSLSCQKEVLAKTFEIGQNCCIHQMNTYQNRQLWLFFFLFFDEFSVHFQFDFVIRDYWTKRYVKSISNQETITKTKLTREKFKKMRFVKRGKFIVLLCTKWIHHVKHSRFTL